MKQALKFLSAALLPLFMFSCAPAEEEPADFTVVATFYPVYLAAANITDGIDGVTLSLLTPPDTGCLHDYQLSPGELESVKGADLVLALDEGFLPRIKQAYPGLNIYEYGGEEHCWVYVDEYINMVSHIGSAIINADPDRVDGYENNIRLYLEDLAQLSLEMKTGLMNIGGSPVIMFHEGFESWRTAYGINIAATIEREPGTAPTPRELAETIELAEELDVKALFTEPQYPSDSARTVAAETGAEVYALDPVASGPMDLDYYQQAMRDNLETLISALGEE